MNLTLYRATNGPCPYLESREWIVHVFQSPILEGEIYEHLLNYGFRRSGTSFYQNHCPNCNECVSLRIPVADFKPTKSQRRILKKNQDLKITREKVSFQQEDFELYQKYCNTRHEKEEQQYVGDYKQFLINSPVETQMMRYYFQEKLIGVAWLDLLPESISSVYFAFDPQYSNRSLGNFSILKEIELCKELSREWYHLGFWVRGSQKMSYKAQFHPYQRLVSQGEWADSSGDKGEVFVQKASKKEG